MTERNAFDFTTGEGSVLVEIDAELAPLTPEVLSRPRVRAPWLRPESDPGASPGEHAVDGPPPVKPK